jgi:hypothetical protein
LTGECLPQRRANWRDKLRVSCAKKLKRQVHGRWRNPLDRRATALELLLHCNQRILHRWRHLDGNKQSPRVHAAL